MSNTTINIGGKMFTFIDSSKLVDKKEEKQIGFPLEKCMEILSQTEITRTDLNITQEELEEEEQDIYLYCWFCEILIIRDSEEHDICHITREGELCCEKCLSCCDCENCEKEEEEDTGFGTAYHDGSGYDDCDPQGKGNRLCGNLSDNDSCSECVYLRREKIERFNEFKLLWDNLDPYETLTKEIIQKLKSLDIKEAYELLIKKE